MPDSQRIVLLNWLVNRSITRSRSHEPLITPVNQLLDIVEDRRVKGWAIEYRKGPDSTDEHERLKLGRGRDFTRLYEIAVTDTDEFWYVAMLLKFADMARRDFRSLMSASSPAASSRERRTSAV